jgi:ABC-2 type transport system ATP-binding protein
MERKAVLTVKELRKAYGDFKAVDGISFEVRRGEVFGLLGPNGAGKTTTIRMICGLLKADSGEITVEGYTLAKNYSTIKAMIGLCPQELVVWGLLTCMEQLKFTALSYGMSAGNAARKAEEILNSLGLADKKNKLAKTLSGGMQRRLNLALALVHDPEIIILDEPQAGLDPQSRILVRDFIRKLAREKTVILTTHDMDEAERLTDRVAIIDYGRVLALDTPENLKEKSGLGDLLQIRVEQMEESVAEKLLQALPAVIAERRYSDGYFYFSGSDLLELIPAIQQVFHQKGRGIKDMTIRKRTLEDVFIAMTGRGLRE